MHHEAGADGMEDYTGQIEKHITTRAGFEILLRPVRPGDEELLREFFSSLSSDSMYNRFTTSSPDLSPEGLDRYIKFDDEREMVIAATLIDGEDERIVGIGQYASGQRANTAEVAFVVEDIFQNKGIARGLLTHLIGIAKDKGLDGFTAEAFIENRAMVHIFESVGFTKEKTEGTRSYELTFHFDKRDG